MKKVTLVLVCALLVLTLILPVGTLVCGLLDYQFKLFSIPVFSIVIALLSLCTVALGLRFKDSFVPLATRILICINVPVSLINALLYIAQCSTWLVIVCTVFSFACGIFLIIQFEKSVTIKSIAFLTAAIIVVPLIFLSMFATVFKIASENTVIKTVTSPNGKNYAKIISSDQGALGGNTFVNVYEGKIDLIVFKISKKPKRVYSGKWDDRYKLNVYWESDDCLIINSREYRFE